MKAYGYIKESVLETPSELKEVTLLLSIKEIEYVINFLKKVKKMHKSVENDTELCHTHFSDIVSRNKCDFDLIIATKIDNNSQNIIS